MTVDMTKKLETYKNEMIKLTDNTLNIDDMHSEKIVLRLGNRTYGLVATDDSVVVEDQIRKEFEDKITEKLAKIKQTVTDTMSNVTSFVSSIQEEYERKERMLKDTMAKAAPMPNVNWEHARRGLSVVKGNGLGEIIWLVKRVYSPKYFDHKNIEPLYVKKLITNIYIKIVTRNDSVLGVSSHYTNSLEYFDHYHQSRPDCWGSWKWPINWKTPDDILRIADDAIAVMENINPMSIAHRAPRLLPRLETIRKHVIQDAPTAPKEVKVGVAAMRDGLNVSEPSADVWGN